MRSRPACARRMAAAVAVLALLATGCTDAPPADPEQALVDTVRATFEAPFSYRLVAEADREALDELGEDLGSVVARLNLFEVAGVVDGPLATADVSLFSTDPLLEVRRFGQDRLYLRVAASRAPLASVLTPELEGRVLGLAVQTGQPESVARAIHALFDEQWVGIAGAFDPAALLDGDTAAGDDRPGQDPATPLPALVADQLVVQEQVDDDGRTRFRVALRVRDLLRVLASLGAGVDTDAFEEGLALLPETVTGDVVVRDDRVQQVVFDVAAAAREDGVDIPGSLELRLELSDHGDPPPPTEPDAAVVVPSGELAAGLSSLLSPPAPSDRPTGTPTPGPTPAPTPERTATPQ